MNVEKWARDLSARAADYADALGAGQPSRMHLARVEALVALTPTVLEQSDGWSTSAPTADGLYLVRTLRGTETGLFEFGHWHTAEGDRRIGVSHWRAIR